MEKNNFLINYTTKLADAEELNVEFYLKNWLPIPKGSITMITAPGGSGKSYLSIQIALRMILENKENRILLWNTEDAVGEMKKRSNKILKYILKNEELDISNIDVIDNSKLPVYFNDGNNKEFLEYFKKYNLIILDPLISFYSGEENNNSEARRFMNLLNKIAINNNQSIIIVHHHNKKDKEGNSRTRGASAFVDAVRLLYEIQPLKNYKTLKKIEIAKDNKGVTFMVKNDNFIIKVLPFNEPTKEEKIGVENVGKLFG